MLISMHKGILRQEEKTILYVYFDKDEIILLLNSRKLQQNTNGELLIVDREWFTKEISNYIQYPVVMEQDILIQLDTEDENFLRQISKEDMGTYVIKAVATVNEEPETIVQKQRDKKKEEIKQVLQKLFLPIPDSGPHVPSDADNYIVSVGKSAEKLFAVIPALTRSQAHIYLYKHEYYLHYTCYTKEERNDFLHWVLEWNLKPFYGTASFLREHGEELRIKLFYP